jgi:hypothetical protein
MSLNSIEDFLFLEKKIITNDESVLYYLCIRNSIFRLKNSSSLYSNELYGISKLSFWRKSVNLLKNINTFLRFYKMDDLDRKVIKNIYIISGSNKDYNGENDAFVKDNQRIFNNGSADYLVLNLGDKLEENEYNIKSIWQLSSFIAFIISHFYESREFKKLLNTIDRFYVQLTPVKRRFLVRKYYSNKFFLFFIKIVINKTKFKNLESAFIEEGHYQDKILLNNYLKSLGVIVSEQQHGVIHASHDGYVFSDILREKFKHYYPDFLLLYGNFWSLFCRVPNKTRVYGKYFGMYDGYLSATKNIGSVLLIGTGYKTKEQLDFYNKLCKKYPDQMIAFRPHPSERELCKEFIRLNHLSVSLDTSSLALSLSKADYLVGEMSTVLFEGSIFGCKSIFINSYNFKVTGFQEFVTPCDYEDFFRECSTLGDIPIESLKDVYRIL